MFLQGFYNLLLVAGPGFRIYLDAGFQRGAETIQERASNDRGIERWQVNIRRRAIWRLAGRDRYIVTGLCQVNIKPQHCAQPGNILQCSWRY
ncbi:hypothetical protein D3C87_1785580 [compost metagenome]